jgi:hypothetical protein
MANPISSTWRPIWSPKHAAKNLWIQIYSWDPDSPAESGNFDVWVSTSQSGSPQLFNKSSLPMVNKAVATWIYVDDQKGEFKTEYQLWILKVIDPTTPPGSIAHDKGDVWYKYIDYNDGDQGPFHIGNMYTDMQQPFPG